MVVEGEVSPGGGGQLGHSPRLGHQVCWGEPGLVLSPPPRDGACTLIIAMKAAIRLVISLSSFQF